VMSRLSGTASCSSALFSLTARRPLCPPLFPYTTLFRSRARLAALGRLSWAEEEFTRLENLRWTGAPEGADAFLRIKGAKALQPRDRKSTRLNSSHQIISYAVFCLKKKKTTPPSIQQMPR